MICVYFFSSRRRHTRYWRDWSSDVCSSDLIIYGKIKKDIGQILRKLCEYKGVEIIEANACTDHIHMLVSISPKLSVAQFMGYLKGKSSLMIFEIGRAHV